MMIPSIHLNGTSKEELLNQVKENALAISSTIETLQHNRPHGRDYYPQNRTADIYDAYRKASEEYEARITSLKTMYQDFVALFNAIEDGGFKR